MTSGLFTVKLSLVGWSVETNANVMVAAGTLLLAIATFWSVLETRRVLRGEDRRMQQNRAPYLTTSFETEHDEPGGVNKIIGFRVTNAGYGLARDVSITLNVYHSIDAEGETTEELIADAKTKNGRPYRIQAFCDILPEKGSAVARLVDWRGFGADVRETIVARASIRYVDSFGNAYQTLYEDWYEHRNRWITPTSLRLK